MSSLAIVTVVTNEKANLKDLYQSLKEQTYKDFTVYFVDNNSIDGSMDYFRELNSDSSIKVKYINLDYNSGFSEGSNIGAKEATKDNSKYLFISNNDLVLDKSALQEMYNLAESANIVCTGPLLMQHKERNPNIIQEFGGKINFKLGSLEKYYPGQNVTQINLPETLKTDFVGGGVCFIRADVFQKIGMYETSYFGYFDEIDLSYRLKVLNNYEMMSTSKAVVWHNHNWTKKNNLNYYFEYYLSERNKFLYYHKFKMYPSMIFMSILDVLRFPWRLIWFIKVCDFKLGMYYLKGMLDGLLNRKGKPKLSFVK